MYCMVEFSEHLLDNPEEELDDLELPEVVEGKGSFWELQVCASPLDPMQGGDNKCSYY